jgi:hypothetical protein
VEGGASALVRAALVAGLVVAFAGTGCGGEEERASRPAIPRDVAEQLAAQSLDVAETLESGDAYRAAELADSLRASAREAIERGQVPAPLGRELERAVARLSRQIDCAPTARGDEREPGEDSGPDEEDGGDTTTSTSPDTTTTDATTTVDDTTTTLEETTTLDEG